MSIFAARLEYVIRNGDDMTLSELLPTIQSLPRADKLRLIQMLTADVGGVDDSAGAMADKTVPIWSPHDAIQGAATLLSVLEADDEEVVS